MIEFRPHQTKVIPKIAKADEFALFQDMGSGKTLTAIAAVDKKFENKLIKQHLVICPTSIKLVWADEYINKWGDFDSDVHIYQASKKTSADKFVSTPPTNKLKVLVVGVEALSKYQFFICEKFVKAQKTHITVDESTTIKNYSAMRTKNAYKLARLSASRLIMTGSPSANGIHDLYSQFFFLNPNIIGLKSYFVFKSMYCQMGGFEAKKIIGYQNTEFLWGKLKPHVDIRQIDKTKFPKQIKMVVPVEVTPQQKSIIKELEDSFGSILFDKKSKVMLELSTTTVLERLIRFQQVLGGSFPHQEYGENLIKNLDNIPKLTVLIETIKNLPHDSKIIIWARFVPEIHRIVKELESANIGEVVTFFGDINQKQRDLNSKKFQHGNARFMVANKSGSMGLTWTASNYNIYYSNDYSYSNRIQSERRSWGRDHLGGDVVYIDLVSDSKYDRVIQRAIEQKKDVAKFVLSSLDSDDWDKKSQPPLDDDHKLV